MIDCNIIPYLAYVDSSDTHYHFKLRLITQPVLDFLSLPVSFKDAIITIAKKILQEAQSLGEVLPRYFPPGSYFPLHNNLFGSYQLPTGAYFDRLEGLPIVSIENYTTFAIFSGLIPLILTEADVYYAKDSSDLTDIPESIPDTIKLPALPSGAIPFTPTKATYGLGTKYASYRGTSDSIAWLAGAFLYEGLDCNLGQHIWCDWENFNPSSNSYVYHTYWSLDGFPPFDIPWGDAEGPDGDPVYFAGFSVWKYHYSDWYYTIFSDYYTSTPYYYYPRREPDSTSGESPLYGGILPGLFLLSDRIQELFGWVPVITHEDEGYEAIEIFDIEISLGGQTPAILPGS